MDCLIYENGRPYVPLDRTRLDVFKKKKNGKLFYLSEIVPEDYKTLKII